MTLQATKKNKNKIRAAKESTTKQKLKIEIIMSSRKVPHAIVEKRYCKQ